MIQKLYLLFLENKIHSQNQKAKTYDTIQCESFTFEKY